MIRRMFQLVFNRHLEIFSINIPQLKYVCKFCALNFSNRCRQLFLDYVSDFSSSGIGLKLWLINRSLIFKAL